LEKKLEIKVWTVKVFRRYPHDFEVEHYHEYPRWEVRTSVPGASVKKFKVEHLLKALAYAIGYYNVLWLKKGCNDIVNLVIDPELCIKPSEVKKGIPIRRLSMRLMNVEMPPKERITFSSLMEEFKNGYKAAERDTKEGLEALTPYDQAL
jgi:hypothetical protein